jgi:hypothetical protein
MTETFFKTLENELKEINIIMFSYAWREKTTEWLKTETRFTALIRWLSAEIAEREKLVAAFNPADNLEHFDFYYSQLAELSFMLHAHESILSPNCTNSIRDAWERKICEFFKIHYSEKLGTFVN